MIIRLDHGEPFTFLITLADQVGDQVTYKPNRIIAWIGFGLHPP
jgi:hypothetical protein